MNVNPSVLFLVFSWCLISDLRVHAQADQIQVLAGAQAAKVDAAVQAEMERQGLVGVAVGILQDGKIVYLRGYGLSDKSKQSPVTTKSIFNWASNSKPLAAVAAMQLVEKKQLDLDIDVRVYVPEFPAKEHPITMRQLLCHQSGIQHYGKVVPTKRAYSSKFPHLDPVLALDVFNQTPLLQKPGEKVVYSTYAYILASAVIQKAGQAPMDHQIMERIGKPLGMTSLQLDTDYANQPDWTVGYTKMGGSVIRAAEEANYWKHGGGSYKSNIEDFARWAQALLNHRLVTTETEKHMWTRQKTSDGKLTAWGLGFTVDEQNGMRVSHGGKQTETTTRMVLYPLKRQGMVVMTNCGFGDPGAITTAIYKAMSDTSK